ncbi:MAG: hypothetical protein M0Q90_15285 [Bacteroidales bacterium]|nr:hypothetical protein [Bacteroidales bacterium]
MTLRCSYDFRFLLYFYKHYGALQLFSNTLVSCLFRILLELGGECVLSASQVRLSGDTSESRPDLSAAND